MIVRTLPAGVVRTANVFITAGLLPTLAATDRSPVSTRMILSRFNIVIRGHCRPVPDSSGVRRIAAEISRFNNDSQTAHADAPTRRSRRPHKPSFLSSALFQYLAVYYLSRDGHVTGGLPRRRFGASFAPLLCSSSSSSSSVSGGVYDNQHCPSLTSMMPLPCRDAQFEWGKVGSIPQRLDSIRPKGVYPGFSLHYIFDDQGIGN